MSFFFLENTLEKLEITMIGKQYAELTLCDLLKGPRSVSSGLILRCSPGQNLKRKHHSAKVYAEEETLRHEKNIFLMWTDRATYLGQPCPHRTRAETSH